MSQVNQTLYLPYGAYELKATYQRNLGVALLTVSTFVITLLAIGWTLSALNGATDGKALPDDRVETRIVLPPPMTINRPEPRIDPTGSAQPTRRAVPNDVIVPSALNIVDDDLEDKPVRMATNEERSKIVDGGTGGSGEIGSETGVEYGALPIEDYLPGIDEFVPRAEEPELIGRVKPDYPRLAKMRGDEGTVIIKALVGKEGDVLEAVVFGSSGHVLLDEAALAVAGLYKYRPAIQNRRPIAVWVTYNVEFRLD